MVVVDAAIKIMKNKIKIKLKKFNEDDLTDDQKVAINRILTHPEHILYTRPSINQHGTYSTNMKWDLAQDLVRDVSWCRMINLLGKPVKR